MWRPIGSQNYGGKTVGRQETMWPTGQMHNSLRLSCSSIGTRRNNNSNWFIAKTGAQQGNLRIRILPVSFLANVCANKQLTKSIMKYQSANVCCAHNADQSGVAADIHSAFSRQHRHASDLRTRLCEIAKLKPIIKLLHSIGKGEVHIAVQLRKHARFKYVYSFAIIVFYKLFKLMQNLLYIASTTRQYRFQFIPHSRPLQIRKSIFVGCWSQATRKFSAQFHFQCAYVCIAP